MIEQTRFFSTVFLCTAFKLENIYLGVNLCGNFISGNSVYRYLKQIEGEIVACVQTPTPPPRISIGRGACQPPSPPGISVIFQLGLVPSGKNICVKKLLHCIF